MAFEIIAVIAVSSIFPALTHHGSATNIAFSQPDLNNTDDNNIDWINNVTRPNDPNKLQIPLFESEKLNKSMIVRLIFASENQIHQVHFGSASVAFEPAKTNIGNPPLVHVQVLDHSNNIIQEFNEWHPLWRFVYDGSTNQESLTVEAVAEGRFVFPFDPRIAFMRVTDLTISPELSGNEYMFDLRPSIRDFCQLHPDDPDCQNSDLAIVNMFTYPFRNITIQGEEEQAVTASTTAINNGKDSPADAVIQTSLTINDTGLQIAPATELTTVEVDMERGVERQTDHLYRIQCLEPGTYNVTFSGSITLWFVGPIVDLEPANNSGQSNLIISCLE